MLDGVTYAVADSRALRGAAFELVHDAYVESGLMHPHPSGMRITPWHLTPTTDVFVALHQGQVIYTMTLISDDKLGVPMQSLYSEELAARQAASVYYAEVSCLASRNEYFGQRRMFEVFVRLVGLMFQYARHNDIERLVIAVHPRHFRFYRRFLGFEQFGDQRAYGCVRGNPAVACEHDFSRLDLSKYQLYDQVYAHRFARWELLRQPMLVEDREYFESAALVADGPIVAA